MCLKFGNSISCEDTADKHHERIIFDYEYLNGFILGRHTLHKSRLESSLHFRPR